MQIVCVECGWEGEDYELELSYDSETGFTANFCPCCGAEDSTEEQPMQDEAA